jgi:hypothetical protein
MRLRLIQVTRRASGRESRRASECSGSLLALGRGTDCDIVLGDLSVALRHAELTRKGDGVYLRAVGGRELLLSGERLAGEARITTGAVFRIGPYELRAVEPEAGFDFALELEEVVRRAGALEKLIANTQIGVERSWRSRRLLSWLGIAAVLSVFLALPLATGRAGSWSSGPLSRSHSFAAEDCAKCHTDAFRTVSNAACVGCHERIGNHAPSERLAAAEMADQRCTECHSEHAADSGLLARAQDSCTACHAELAERIDEPRVADAADFADAHPEFRLALAQPAGEPPTRVEWRRDLEENSGLAFSHQRHVAEPLPDVPLALRSDPDRSSDHLRCSACHELDAGGARMREIEFERHCQSCHSLGFDAQLPDDQAPHTDPFALRQALVRVYSAQLLAGNAAQIALPDSLQFRVPGAPLSPAEQGVAQSFLARSVRAAEAALFDDPGECKRCHALEPGSAADAAGDGALPTLDPPLRVRAVTLTPAWLPESNFRHATHEPFPCADCHAAAAAYIGDGGETPRPAWSQSEAGPFALRTEAELEKLGLAPSAHASDLLIPGIAACRDCHGGASARPPDVPSECTLCHGFHRREFGVMGGESAPSAHFLLKFHPLARLD